MEFHFDTSTVLHTNEDGIAIIDAENPPAYMRTTQYSGFNM